MKLKASTAAGSVVVASDLFLAHHPGNVAIRFGDYLQEVVCLLLHSRLQHEQKVRAGAP